MVYENLEKLLLQKLTELKRLRVKTKSLDEKWHKFQSQAIPVMEDIDLDNKGFVVDVDGKSFRAKVVSPEASEYYDPEKLVPILQERGYWDSVKSEVLDIDKLEKELKNGTIPRSLVRPCLIKGKAPSKYVGFYETKRRKRRV